MSIAPIRREARTVHSDIKVLGFRYELVVFDIPSLMVTSIR